MAGVATVVDGIVTFDDSAAKYNKADAGNIFTDYKVVNRYESDRCTYMMGITAPGGFQGGSAAFTQLALPTLLWIADWTACRVGSQPVIPDTTPGDSNWILLDEILEPVMITVLDDGFSPLYRISGIYVYGHRNPNADVSRNIRFPRPPWLQDVFDRTMPASSFQKYLIDNAAGAGNSVNPTYTPNKQVQ